MDTSPRQAPPPDLRQLIMGYRVAQIIHVAAELDLAEIVAAEPKHYTEIAAACGAHPPTLLRLLRALASLGIFEQVSKERFGLNPTAALLRRSTPNSLWAVAMLAGTQHYPAWGNLLHTVLTGETAFDAMNGEPVWEFRARDARAGEIFNEAMNEGSPSKLEAVLSAYDFSRFRILVDVGGGKGGLLAGLLQANPQARGILLDMPEPVRQARARFGELGLDARCEFVAGSFLDSVPSGGDVYILSRILHDWGDVKAEQILQNCRRAMKQGDTLLVIDRAVSVGKPSPEALLGDLSMMVINGGRERTEPEFRALLASAGFDLTRVIPTRAISSIIEALAVM